MWVCFKFSRDKDAGLTQKKKKKANLSSPLPSCPTQASATTASNLEKYLQSLPREGAPIIHEPFDVSSRPLTSSCIAVALSTAETFSLLLPPASLHNTHTAHTPLTHRSHHVLVLLLFPQRPAINFLKLRRVLLGFGEYPTKYRKYIWKRVLNLPGNVQAFNTLSALGTHPAYEHIQEIYPIRSRKLQRVLQRFVGATKNTEGRERGRVQTVIELQLVRLRVSVWRGCTAHVRCFDKAQLACTPRFPLFACACACLCERVCVDKLQDGVLSCTLGTNLWGASLSCKHHLSVCEHVPEQPGTFQRSARTCVCVFECVCAFAFSQATLHTSNAPSATKFIGC